MVIIIPVADVSNAVCLCPGFVCQTRRRSRALGGRILRARGHGHFAQKTSWKRIVSCAFISHKRPHGLRDSPLVLCE